MTVMVMMKLLMTMMVIMMLDDEDGDDNLENYSDDEDENDEMGHEMIIAIRSTTARMHDGCKKRSNKLSCSAQSICSTEQFWQHPENPMGVDHDDKTTPRVATIINTTIRNKYLIRAAANIF